MQSLFILLLAVGFISTVSTYQCYVCSSPGDDGCGDPFNSNAMTDDKKRDAGGQVCMKTKVTTAVITGVLRMLSPPEACTGIMNSCRDVTTSDGTSTVCCCNSNLCNGALRIGQQSLVVYLIIATLAIITYGWF